MSVVPATVEDVLGNGTRLCHAFVAWSEGAIPATREMVPIASAVRVLPNQTVQMTTRPQHGLFYVDRLIVPTAVAPHFVINDIIIGNRTQMAQPAAIPADLFAASTPDAFVSFGPVQTAMDITIVATCVSDNPEGVVFHAALLGRIGDATGLLTFKALALLDDAAYLFTDCAYARVGRIAISRLDGEELDDELDGHEDQITLETPRVVGLRVANLKNAERRLYAIDDALGVFVFDLGVDNRHAMVAYTNRDGYTPAWFAQLERKERSADRRRAKKAQRRAKDAT